MSYQKEKAWVVTEEGTVKLFGPDGKEIQVIKRFEMTTDSMPLAKVELHVNVGSREDMESFIATGETPEQRRTNKMISEMKERGTLK